MRHFSIITLSFVAALAVSGVVIESISDRPPKESAIVNDFRTHRTSFERVRTMLTQDSGVEGVATWGIQLNGSPIWENPPDGGMPVKRYQEYVALLGEIGAKRVEIPLKFHLEFGAPAGAVTRGISTFAGWSTNHRTP